MYKWRRKSFFNYDYELTEAAIKIKCEKNEIKILNRAAVKGSHDSEDLEDEAVYNSRTPSVLSESDEQLERNQPEKMDKIKKLLSFKNKCSQSNSNKFLSKRKRKENSNADVSHKMTTFKQEPSNKNYAQDSSLPQLSSSVTSKSMTVPVDPSHVSIKIEKDDEDGYIDVESDPLYSGNGYQSNNDSLNNDSSVQKKNPVKPKRKSRPGVVKVNKKFIREDGNFKCTLCNYDSRYITRFEVHMKHFHPGVAIFQCEICKYETRSKSYLSVHSMNHFGLKPYKCNLCDYASSRKAYLNLHIKSHSKVHTFKCTECNYTTYRTDYLYRHTTEKHRKEFDFYFG